MADDPPCVSSTFACASAFLVSAFVATSLCDPPHTNAPSLAVNLPPCNGNGGSHAETHHDRDHSCDIELGCSDRLGSGPGRNGAGCCRGHGKGETGVSYHGQPVLPDSKA